MKFTISIEPYNQIRSKKTQDDNGVYFEEQPPEGKFRITVKDEQGRTCETSINRHNNIKLGIVTGLALFLEPRGSTKCTIDSDLLQEAQEFDARHL